MILTGVPGNPGIPAIPNRPWSPLSPFYTHTNTHIYRYMGAYFLSSFTIFGCIHLSRLSFLSLLPLRSLENILWATPQLCLTRLQSSIVCWVCLANLRSWFSWQTIEAIPNRSSLQRLPVFNTVGQQNKHMCLYEYTYHRWSWLSRFPLWTLWRNTQMRINNRFLHFDTDQVRARTATRVTTVIQWSDAHSRSRKTGVSFHARLSSFSLKEWQEFTVSSKNTRKW